MYTNRDGGLFTVYWCDRVVMCAQERKISHSTKYTGYNEQEEEEEEGGGGREEEEEGGECADLSCLRANSNIFILRTKSFIRFS